MSTRRILGAAAVAALAVPLAAVPASADPSAPSFTGVNASSSSVDAHADGRQVAEALLFASGSDGAMVAALPSFAPAVPVLEQHRQDASVVSGLLDSMAAYDPTLFAVVGGEIRSGDPYRVEAALLRLTEAVQGAAADAGASWDAAGMDVVPPQSAAVLFAAAVVAGAVTAVGVANVVAAANALWTVNWAFAADEGDRATQVVAEVTEAFAS